jgi:uncharacterized protein (DUF736 family)
MVFQPIEAKGDKSPSYRLIGPIKTGDVEFGAAWKKRSEEGRDYLSVKLADPSLAQPLNCALVEPSDGEELILVWSRDRRQSYGRSAGAVRKGRP